MTPEEKGAVEKAVQTKKQRDLTAMDLIAIQQKPSMGDCWSAHDPMYRRRPPAEQKPTAKEQQ